MRELTERQGEVLAWVTGYVDENSYPPTVREVAEHFSISVKGAYDHLAALKKKNKLSCDDKKSRTISILRPETGDGSRETFLTVPLLGQVAAGRPIFAEENWDGTISVPQGMLRRTGTFFALRVKGNSMEGAGILDGDLAVIEKREVASDGEIVVALLEDSVTLKRFFRESSRIRLQPENPAFSPIYCQELKILGRMAGLLRSY